MLANLVLVCRRIAIVAFAFLSLLAAEANAQYVSDNSFELQLLAVINGERTNAGVPSLTTDPHLRVSAESHLEQLVTHGEELSDRYPGELSLAERMAAAHVPCSAGGEILLKIPDTMTNEPVRIQEALQTEQSQAVILNRRYSAAGFAVAQSDFYIYAVGDFATRMREMSSEEAEHLAAQELQKLVAQSKLPPFEIGFSKSLRDLACSAAKSDSLETGLDLQPNMFVFTADDPEHSEMLSKIAKHQTPVYSPQSAKGDPNLMMGACFAKTRSYPCGRYWFVVSATK